MTFPLCASDWIALSSAFVAVLALGLTFWEAHVSRHHNKLSVRPILSASYNVRRADEMLDFTGIRLNNKGLGPAFIRQIDFHDWSGQRMILDRANADAIFKTLGLTNTPSLMYRFHGLDVLPSNASLKLLYAPQGQMNDELLARLASAVTAFRAVVYYESLYGDQFALAIASDASPPPKQLQKAIKVRSKALKRLRF